jgi:hypothetical protein
MTKHLIRFSTSLPTPSSLNRRTSCHLVDELHHIAKPPPKDFQNTFEAPFAQMVCDTFIGEESVRAVWIFGSRRRIFRTRGQFFGRPAVARRLEPHDMALSIQSVRWSYKRNSAPERGYDGMKRWVGLGIMAAALINIGNVLAARA